MSKNPKLQPIADPLMPPEPAGLGIPVPWRQIRPAVAGDRQRKVDRPAEGQDCLAGAHPSHRSISTRMRAASNTVPEGTRTWRRRSLRRFAS